MRPRLAATPGCTGPVSHADRRVARGSGDRGAALAEVALIMPLFAFFLFGVLEGGLLFRDWHTMGDATQNAVRSASIGADSQLADYDMLQAVRIASAVVPGRTIERIVIYKAENAGDEPPASCRAGQPSSTNACNVYTPADWQRPPSDFGCRTAGALDSFWCPSDRRAVVGRSDLVGVWIQARHEYLTGLFGPDVTITGSATLPLEASRV